MLEPEEARTAREGIADTLTSIDRGDLDATKAQRAYLAGVRDAIAAGEPDVED